MKSVILAAGRGSRLRPITDKIHKSLLKVGSERILGWQIRNYIRQGVKEIYVVTGYKAKEVKQFINKLDKNINLGNKINIIHSNKWSSTDNLYSLYLTEAYVRGDAFVLSNADVIAEKTIFEAICSKRGKAIVPYDSQNIDPEALMLETRDGRPSAILDKGSKSGAGATIGMFSFDENASEALFSDIENHIDLKGEKTQWFEASLDRIFSEVRFKSMDIGGSDWVEIDSVDDLRRAWRNWAGDMTSFENYVSSFGK
jgi:choline kinase